MSIQSSVGHRCTRVVMLVLNTRRGRSRGNGYEVDVCVGGYGIDVYSWGEIVLWLQWWFQRWCLWRSHEDLHRQGTESRWPSRHTCFNHTVHITKENLHVSISCSLTISSPVTNCMTITIITIISGCSEHFSSRDHSWKSNCRSQLRTSAI